MTALTADAALQAIRVLGLTHRPDLRQLMVSGPRAAWYACSTRRESR